MAIQGLRHRATRSRERTTAISDEPGIDASIALAITFCVVLIAAALFVGLGAVGLL